MNLRRHLGRAAIGGAGAMLGYRALARLRRLATFGRDTLDGKVVVITGGSRGLGLVMARAFAARGCKLALCARDEGELERARHDLEARGAEVITAVCDVSQRTEVESFIAVAADRFGGIDVVVNNAGIIQVGPVDDMTIGDFEEALAVNFWGGVYTSFAALPHLRARRGRIVNIASIGGKVAVPHLLPYDCAKFALIGFSEGLRSELLRDGVSVTTIVPGLMRTGSPLHAEFKGQAEREFGWFSLGAALPISAMSAERAARRIVKATLRREAEVTLSIQAKILRLAHDLFPGLMSDLLAVVQRLLPRPDGNRVLRPGYALATEAQRKRLAPSAAPHNQLGGPRFHGAH